MTGRVFLDSFSGGVAELTATETRDSLIVLQVLHKDPNVSTWDMGEKKLYVTIATLKNNGWIKEEERAFPWHYFKITDAGLKALGAKRRQP